MVPDTLLPSLTPFFPPSKSSSRHYVQSDPFSLSSEESTIFNMWEVAAIVKVSEHEGGIIV
jgi:hypothetical protein